MNIKIVYRSQYSNKGSLDIDAISGGISLEDETVTIHSTDKGSLVCLKNHGFEPINEVMENIMTRKINVESEVTIIGIVCL